MSKPDHRDDEASSFPKAVSDALGTLASVPFLADLTRQELQALAERARLCPHPQGAQIFAENQQATGFHVLVDGLVKICHFTAEGREMVLHLIRPGGTFGEAAVFQGGTFPASAVAMQASRSLLLPGPFFMQLVRGNPDLALRIIAILSLRLRMFTRNPGICAKRLSAWPPICCTAAVWTATRRPCVWTPRARCLPACWEPLVKRFPVL